MSTKVTRRTSPAYKQRAEVKAFIEWLAQHLGSNQQLKHAYVNRKTGKHWRFADLYDAYQQYEWQHPGVPHLKVSAGCCAASNTNALNALSADLSVANCDVSMVRGAKATMFWGGVSARNNQWLEVNQKGLANTVTQVAQVLRGGDLDSPQFQKDLRFNAGMTKVYSLICQDFIIYDSRVAAALGMLVVIFCKEKGLRTLPGGLRFPWAPAKEGENAAVPKRRNPSKGDAFKFPGLRRGHHHAIWNMRASWILSQALAHHSAAPSPFHGGDAGALRRIEMALFMIGYDLGTVTA
jgi:hypothetical protein